MRTSADPPNMRDPRPGLFAALLLVGFMVMMACADSGPPLGNETFRRTEPIEGVAAPIGGERCGVCHGHQEAPRHHLDCEGCHGSGARHVQNVSDPAHIRYPSNAVCLDCHATGHRTLLEWESAEHREAGLLCGDCHDPHNSRPDHLREPSQMARNLLPDAREATRLCVGCHADVAAQLNLPSHHPIREGMLGCTDCHQPHAAKRASLGLETSGCTGCHQPQGGPYLYEHAPVVEDCGHCHVPHGATAESLLIANQPGACVFCHSVAEAGAVHDPQAFVTRCTDCHLAVHGSFADPHLRR